MQFRFAPRVRLLSCFVNAMQLTQLRVQVIEQPITQQHADLRYRQDGRRVFLIALVRIVRLDTRPSIHK